jgi:hypothetical protein
MFFSREKRNDRCFSIGSDCSGPCKTCKLSISDCCLAGHGDDDYSYASPEWIAEYLNRKENKK